MKKRYLLGLILSFVITAGAADTIRINEIMSVNVLTIGDEKNEYDDWLELYNPSATAVNLNGYYLSDDATRLNKWEIASANPSQTTIQPGSYLLIWADDDTGDGPLHANFKLSGEGEKLFLVAPDGIAIVDSMTFPAIPADYSYGRSPNGANTIGFMPQPSPNHHNTQYYNSFAGAPFISQASGFYNAAITVSLQASHPDEVIYYTLDGSQPDMESFLYTSPITISQTCVLKAFSYRANYGPSPIASASYFINTEHHLPVLSMIIDPASLFDAATGIYTNHLQEGRAWERKADFEFFKDGSQAFNISAGVRIQGNTGREMAKKSFRLFFRDGFGAERLEYPLFRHTSVQSFTNLVLRAGYDDDLMADNGTLLRDPLVNEMWRRLGFLTSHSQLALLYINGQYWGIYDMRESINEDFIHDYCNYDDMDMIRYRWADWELIYGTADAFNEFMDYIENANLVTDAEFAKVEQAIDLENFTAIQALSHPTEYRSWTYGATMFKSNEPGAKWRWTVWDMDRAYATSDWNGFSFYTNTSGEYWPNIITQKLIQNQKYRQTLITRICDLLNTMFVPDNVNQLLDSLQSEITPDIPYELERWNCTEDKWLENVDILRYKIGFRPDLVRQQMQEYFNTSAPVDLALAVQSGQGIVKVNTVTVDELPWTGKYFPGIPVEITALPKPGYRFAGWGNSHLSTDSHITLNLVVNTTLTPVFEKLENTNTELIAPSRVRSGSILPVVARVRNSAWNFDPLVQGVAQVQSSPVGINSSMTIKRGAGTVVLPVNNAGNMVLSITNPEIPAAQKNITATTGFPLQQVSGTLPTGVIHWTSGADYLLTSDLTIPSGTHLTIDAGVNVLIRKKVNITVNGDIEINGTATDPVLFTSEERNQPWGGFDFSGSEVDIAYCFFVNGGGDSTKGWNHGNYQPILFARNDTEMRLNNCYILNSPGKAWGASTAKITANECVTAFVYHGGELLYTLLNYTNSYMMNIPNDDGIFEDKDSDGFHIDYLYPNSNEYSVIDHCFFINGKDDAVDHHASRLRVQNCWIEGFMHEGVASSGQDTIRIYNTVIQNCDQGIECGWTDSGISNGPLVFADHCVVINNNTGLRYGDSYDWSYHGHLTATNMIIYNNDDNIRNYLNSTLAPAPDAIDISYSMTNDDDYNNAPFCITGVPVFDEKYYLLPGSPGVGKGMYGANMGLEDNMSRLYGPVIITEIMYNATADRNSGDWIELYNPQAVAQDIAGWILKDDHDDHEFVFPPGSIILPDSLVVVCEDTVLFHDIHPQIKNIFGNVSFGYGRSDQVRLFSPILQPVDNVTYANKAPWPAEADGNGYSLSLKSITLDNALAASWVASLIMDGTPGRKNSDSMSNIDRDKLPHFFCLKQNYPNPFNAQTTITWDLLKAAGVSLTLYNIQGQVVARLIENKAMPAGAHRYIYNAGAIASGVYFYCLEINQPGNGLQRSVKKMLVMK
ncbi:MAG TPA: CotH kinase family protein [bacterium]|nr:CotH kinase family protein [bacterium]HPN44150.1 CotH kinase family protein [bacterium]